MDGLDRRTGAGGAPVNLVGLGGIRAAADRIAGQVVRTPLLPCPWADERRPLWLKPENLQPTGSFKMRGALNALGALDAGVRAHGVVTHSSGNHGRALAWAARLYGVPAVVVMPEGIRVLGAEIVIVPPAEREARVAVLAAERGLAVVPPFEHRDVIAGQGTIGLEILADLPAAGTVLVPVGGGGLVSGVAVALKALSPGVRVIGVEPELAGDLAEGFAKGRRVVWDPVLTYRTVADGVRLPAVGELNWRHIERYVDDVVTVSEQGILDAMSRLVWGSRIVAEPSGAVAVAAYTERPDVTTGPTVAVVTGGNVDPALLVRVLNA